MVKKDQKKDTLSFSFFTFRLVFFQTIKSALISCILLCGDLLLIPLIAEKRNIVIPQMDTGLGIDIVLGCMGVAGAILGLYCSNITSIYATKYANAPQNIATLFQQDIISNRCIKQIVSYIILCIIFLTLFLFDIDISYLSIAFTLFQTIHIVVLFSATGNRSNILSNTYQISHSIYSKIISIFKKISRNNVLACDKNFQNYFQRNCASQKKLLTKVAKEKGYTNLVHFLDDGISGVTMDRPGFVEMIRQLEQGRAAAVFVKDLSRLGRNYIEVGRLTEEFFPEHDIRLVAVSDNIDTAEGENELAPIRNLFNEWYARDISKKRRISNKIKGNAGEPMGQPPYGYIKDPDNPKRWIVDDEAAQVVRRIYSMTLEGYGTEQIATQLERDEILTPRAYWLKKGIKRPGKGKQQPATKWNSSTVTKILSLQEYCGDILNFKTYSKSYKNKKRLENDRENWVVFKDVHEPIIERSVFEQVQQKRGKIRKRRTNEGEHNMFSGLLVCADCGCNLHFHFNQGNPEIKYFNCSNYKGNRGSCTSTHYVRVDFLEQVVLGEIRRLTKFASLYEDNF